MKLGCILGLDSLAEIGCSVKHDYFDKFVEGGSVNVTGLTSTLGSIYNLPIAHILYAFDK